MVKIANISFICLEDIKIKNLIDLGYLLSIKLWWVLDVLIFRGYNYLTYSVMTKTWFRWQDRWDIIKEDYDVARATKED